MAKPKKENLTKAKITHPVVRTIFGIIAILCILIFSNWLMRATSLGNKTLDLTENKRHTLTPGTKAILSELETPVIIRYYATRKSEAMPRRVKNYMRKVDNLLERYKLLAKDQIRIEYLDPQPDTDAEDSANMDGIMGQRVEDENLYFGLAISSLDQQTSIPFLDPANDTMLEYMLSSAIANVTTFKKPSIGLITTLPLAGTPPTQPGQQPGAPWIIFQLLRQRYDIQYLGMTPEVLDVEKTPVLLLVHPAGISEYTEFLIDQYVLKGGIVVACLDPYALTAPQQDPRMARAMGGGAATKSSTFPNLLKAWGVGMDAFSVIADGKYATDFGNGQRMHSHLSLSTDAITSDDDIVTQGFENLYLPLAGAFTIEGGGGVAIDTLVKSSKQVVMVGGEAATRADQGIFARSQPTGKSYGLVLRLQGKFKTAFPDGAPEKGQAADVDTEDPKAIAEAESSSSVYLISDADFLFDRACFQQTQQGYTAVNNNAALLQNILDQCTGSKHLIGSRSRASTTRPFTIIKEMETDFEKDLHDDVEKAKQSMEKIVQQLQALQQQKSAGKEIVLSQQQETKIRELRAQQMKLRRDLREKEKGLRDRKDQLYAEITWLTVASTPLFVAITGLCVWFFRRRSTRAI